MRFATDPQDVPFVDEAFRRVSTPIPAPGTPEILRRLSAVESRSMHGQLPIVWSRASDFQVFDEGGNTFLDMTSAIFLANVGHSNHRVQTAIQEALTNELISTYAYPTVDRTRYLQRLIDFAGEPFQKAFLMSSGTEASEAVIKLMRLHGMSSGKGLGIISLEGNWHGRTMGAQSLSSNMDQKKWIGALDPNIHISPFPYPWEVDDDGGIAFFSRMLDGIADQGLDPLNDISGFYLETFQGWGALFYPTSFVQALRHFTEENGILLAFDEMQSGFGRTGKRFGFEHYGVKPDLFAVGKAMGNGVPISGVIGTKEIMDLPDVGNMSSTHSGNPLVCRAGEAVLDELLEKNLVEEAHRKGAIFQEQLESLKIGFDEVGYISSRGLIGALIFSAENLENPAEFASKVAETCMQKGLLVVHTGRESIKLGPPLTIPDEAILDAFDVIRESIREVRSA